LVSGSITCEAARLEKTTSAVPSGSARAKARRIAGTTSRGSYATRSREGESPHVPHERPLRHHPRRLVPPRPPPLRKAPLHPPAGNGRPLLRDDPRPGGGARPRLREGHHARPPPRAQSPTVGSRHGALRS